MKQIEIAITLKIEDPDIAEHIKYAATSPDWVVYHNGEPLALTDALSQFLIEGLAPSSDADELYDKWSEMDWLAGAAVAVKWRRARRSGSN